MSGSGTPHVRVARRLRATDVTIRPVRDDTRSDMTRAAGATGWKPYVRKSDDEPPAVLAARERWRAIEAESKRRTEEAHAAWLGELAKEIAQIEAERAAMTVGGEGWDPLGRAELDEIGAEQGGGCIPRGW